MSLARRIARLLALVAILATSGTASADAPAGEPVESSLRAVLSKPEYGFCHDPGYPLLHDEARWCEALHSDGDRCPGLQRNCTAGMGAHQRPSRNDGNVEADGGILAAAATWLLWLLVAALVGAIVVLVVRRAVGGMSGPGDDVAPDEQAGPDGNEEPAAVSPHAIDTDAQRLLAAAKAAATQGRHDRAIELAHAAMIRALERDGLVRVHPSRTNGDHLRDLASRPELRGPAREVVRELERVQFGAAPASPEVSARVIQRAAEAAPQQLGRIVALAVIVALATAGCSGRGAEDDSPTGTRALMSFLQRRGLEPRLRVASITSISRQEQVIVLLPGAPVHDEQTAAPLLAWARRGGTLIAAGVLPQALQKSLGIKPVPCSTANSSLQLNPAFHGTLGNLRVETPSGTCLQLAETTAAAQGDASNMSHSPATAPTPVPPRARAHQPEGEHRQPTSSDDADEDNEEEAEEDGDDDGEDDASAPDVPYVLLERGKQPYAILVNHPQGGEVIVLADDRLFTNAALVVAQDAAFTAALLARGGKRIDLVNALTGAAASTPISAIRRGKLAPFMLQLLALLALVILWRGMPFGARRDVRQDARRSFSEHVRALGALYARARASRHALTLLSTFTLERLRDRMHLRGRRGLGELAETLAARTGRPLGEVARVLAEVWDVSSAPGVGVTVGTARGAAAEQDLQTMRELLELLASAGARPAEKRPSSS